MLRGLLVVLSSVAVAGFSPAAIPKLPTSLAHAAPAPQMRAAVVQQTGFQLPVTVPPVVKQFSAVLLATVNRPLVKLSLAVLCGAALFSMLLKMRAAAISSSSTLTASTKKGFVSSPKSIRSSGSGRVVPTKRSPAKAKEGEVDFSTVGSALTALAGVGLEIGAIGVSAASEVLSGEKE